MQNFSKQMKKSLMYGVVLWSMYCCAGCSKAKAPVQPMIPVVDVTQVITKDVPETAEWVGSIDGLVNAQIRPQVSGYLIKQNYQEGSLVHVGDVLFQIDPRPFRAVLEQAQANVLAAQANFETARANYARIKPLADQNALSKKDLDDAFGAQQTSAAQVKEAKAAVDAAQLNLDFTTIESPITGIAGLAKIQIGNLVSPANTQELTTVSTLDPIKVYIEASEQQYLKAASTYPNATKNRSLELYLADGSLFSSAGSFSFVDRQVNPQTGTIKVAALFPNPNNVLRPGQYARLRATFAMRNNALLVPQRAVMQMQGINQIGVVDKNNTVEIRTVEVGGQSGEYFIIDKGLAAGESVIVEGLDKVKDGVKVSTKAETVTNQDDDNN